MVALRNLTTRFSFETDQRGVNQFNRTVRGMKSELAEIGAILGVGLGTNAILDAGAALDQANVALRTTLQTAENAPQAFSDIQRSIDGVTFAIDGAQKSVRDFATEAELTGLAADFFGAQGIEATNESIEQFQTLLSAATALAVREGQSVEQAFQNILGGIGSGDLSSLLPLGILDRTGAAFEEFRSQLAAGADLLEPQTFARNLDTLVGLLNEAQPQIEGTIRIAGEEGLLPFLEAQKEAESAFEQLGEIGRRALIPLAEVAERIATALNDATKNADSLSDVFINLLPEPVQEFIESFNQPEAPDNAAEIIANPRFASVDDLPEAQRLQLLAQQEQLSQTIAFNQAREQAGLPALGEPIRIEVEVTADQDSFVKVVQADTKRQAQDAKRIISPIETVPAQ